MPLAVRALLEMPELAGVSLIAGASGLDRRVESVNVMEAPDIAQWLRGGELLLSTGYLFREHPDDFEELVMAIHRSGAAALGFKNRFMHEFPLRARELADRLGLPILSLPLDLPYSDIIRIVMLRTDEVEQIRFSEAVLRSFSQIMAEGGDVTRVLQNLRSFLQCDVCFLDAVSGHCFCASEDGFSDVPAARGKKTILEKYAHERLTMSGTTYGYFLFEQYPTGSLWRVAVEHARTAMLLAIQRDIAARQIEARYRDEFVQDLVTNNIRYHEEVLNRARRFGWDLSGPLRCVIFDIDDYKSHFEHPLPEERTLELEEVRQRIYSVCRQEMRPVFREIPYLTMSDSIVFLLNVKLFSDPIVRLRECGESIRRKVRDWTGFTVTIGAGDVKKDFFGVSESYEEARRAIEMMRPLSGGDALYIWDELGIFTVLAVAARSEEAKKFCASRVGRLLRERHRDLLETLRVLVDHDWNFRAAARELGIHYNTMHYRYEKLCQLMELDLGNSSARLELAVALKLLSLNPRLIDG